MWVRNNSGFATLLIVVLLSEVLAILIPVANSTMLDDENVVQILGVIVAGQLAVLALTVPALLEVHSAVLDTDYCEELLDPIELLSGELKSNTVCSFAMFGIAFGASTVLESMPDILDSRIANGPDVNTLFAGVKIALVVFSLLLMWDSIEPLFGLGKAMSLLKKDLDKRRKANRYVRSQKEMEASPRPDVGKVE